MRVIIDQPFGIGDILFLSALVKELDIEEAVWPVADHYSWVSNYLSIDNVVFVKASEYSALDYTSRGFITVPFQHAHSIVGSEARDCMEAKYMLLNADPELWRNITFNRNFDKEQELIALLGVDVDAPYAVVNNHFASKEFNYKADIRLNSDLKVVYIEYVDGFTLLDWSGILERAQEIHTVSTALLFVIEAIKPKAALHLYPRKPLDKDLSPIKSLIDLKWICHE